MENIQDLTEQLIVPNFNLGVALTDSASSLTQGSWGNLVERDYGSAYCGR